MSLIAIILCRGGRSVRSGSSVIIEESGRERESIWFAFFARVINEPLESHAKPVLMEGSAADVVESK